MNEILKFGILEGVQHSAKVCCGVNAPDIRTITKDNVLDIRTEFLLNSAYNGKESNKHIIRVLQYMEQFCII